MRLRSRTSSRQPENLAVKPYPLGLPFDEQATRRRNAVRLIDGDRADAVDVDRARREACRIDSQQECLPALVDEQRFGLQLARVDRRSVDGVAEILVGVN